MSYSGLKGDSTSGVWPRAKGDDDSKHQDLIGTKKLPKRNLDSRQKRQRYSRINANSLLCSTKIHADYSSNMRSSPHT